MALRAIKDFPKATPSTEDLILIEQQGGGRSVSLKELPVSTPVEKKISDVQKDLNARITALAFEPGDTTGDAELRDIRNPADGFTVPAETNAGGAVRAQVTQLDEKISNLKGDLDGYVKNKYDTYVSHNLINGDDSMTIGAITNTGAVISEYTDYAYTDYIPCKKGDIVRTYAEPSGVFSPLSFRWVCFYDTNKNRVGGLSTSANPF